MTDVKFCRRFIEIKKQITKKVRPELKNKKKTTTRRKKNKRIGPLCATIIN